ncbi:MAG: hypothetical protein WC666_02690 [Candidatus Paceibacterota bacterium]|jgi:hypothetical protein
MLDNSQIIEAVEGAAKIRGDLPLPRDFISEALERVNSGKEIVLRYPTGRPSLKGVYDIALRLYNEALQNK